MVIELTNITLIFWDTIGGIIKNLPFYILIIWGVRTIVKQMPKWIEDYDKIKMKHYQIEKAIGRRE